MKNAEPGHRLPQRERIATAVALLVILVIAICLRLATAPIPLERDEGEYVYIGWRWLQGAVPYLDSFNQKTPGSFAVYAAVLRLFGSSPTALHWGIQLYSLATLALVFWLGLRLFGLAEAFVAALLACLLMADPNLYGNAANTETPAILPLTAATIAALRASESGGWKRCALTGALGAAALLFKPQVQTDLLNPSEVLYRWQVCPPYRIVGELNQHGAWHLAALSTGREPFFVCTLEDRA